MPTLPPLTDQELETYNKAEIHIWENGPKRMTTAPDWAGCAPNVLAEIIGKHPKPKIGPMNYMREAWAQWIGPET